MVGIGLRGVPGFSVCCVTGGAGLRDHAHVIVAELAECFDKHADALVRFAASQVGASDADDVVAAAVLGVLQHGVDDVDDAHAYLYRAVANSCRKHWRGVDRRRRRDLVLVVDAVSDSVPVVDDDRLPIVLGALAGLSVQQRAVIHLAYWEDLTPAVSAARLGVSEGTVRRQLARARAKLRSSIDEC